MNQLRACAWVLAALLVPGCAAAGAQAPAGVQAPAGGHGPAAGRLTGKLVIEGGPIMPGGRQPGERPISGTVTFAAAGRRQVSVHVGRAGTFSVWLPPGRYRVSGRSPSVTEAGRAGREEPPCSQPLSVTVTAQRTAAVTVACIVP